MIGRFILAGVALLIGACGMVEAQQSPKIYNTAKQGSIYFDNIRFVDKDGRPK